LVLSQTFIWDRNPFICAPPPIQLATMKPDEAGIEGEFDKIMADAKYFNYRDTPARREAVARLGCKDFPEFTKKMRERIKALNPEIKSQIKRHQDQLKELAAVEAQAKKAK
jgi:hypothetical protein